MAAALPRDLLDGGLVDFLAADERPTFLVDASAPLEVVFSNPACRAATPVYLELTSHSDGWRRWVQNAATGDKFHDHRTDWTLTVLRNRWRAFTATVFPPEPANNVFDVALAAGAISSEHHQRLQATDWAHTSLGPLAEWSIELRQAVALTLAHPEPAAVFWGRERTGLYNEPYIPLIKELHPAALGASAKIHFAAFWDPFEHMFLEVERTGQAIAQRDMPVYMDRSDGVLDEGFFSYAHVPILDAAGRFQGIYNEPREMTEKVVSSRRMSNLVKIGEVSTSILRLDQFWPAILRALDFVGSEVPFAAIYMRDSTSTVDNRPSDRSMLLNGTVRLEGAIGQDVASFPESVDLAAGSTLTTALKQSLVTSDVLFVRLNDLLSPDMIHLDEQKPTNEDTRAVVCSLKVSSPHPTAWIVIGIRHLRRFDHDCNTFINLLVKQISTGATALVQLAEERKGLEDEKQKLATELEVKRKEAEDSAWRFLEFAKHSPMGIYILTRSGGIQFANHAWYQIFDLPIDAQGEQLWREKIHPDDLADVDEKWSLLTDHGLRHAHFECRVRIGPLQDLASNSNYRYISSSCFAEIDDQGNTKSITGVIVDETVHRAHEREVAERLTGAIEAKRTQENFMDMVSHEMRNPLNAIIQCAEEAAQLIEPHTLQHSTFLKKGTALACIESINTILYCGTHQKQLIDDVLTVSKLDSNLLTLAHAASNPTSIAQQALSIYSSEIRSSNIDMSVTPPTAEQIVLLDSGRVLQILINLVGNAVKFMKGRPRRKLDVSVSVSRTRPDSAIVFFPSGQRRQSQAEDWSHHDILYTLYQVQDTGPGLTQDQTATLFGRFKQASPKTHSQYGGSGLGLFISRELTELHGGEIGVMSKPNEGSVFAFYVRGYDPTSNIKQRPIPVVHVGVESGLDPISKSLDDIPAQGMTVLIVEDNIINQNVLGRQLRRAGFRTLAADNGEQALDRLRSSQQISIVLCDLEMPIMDGLTCVKHVRKMQQTGEVAQRIPMVAVTGNARNEQVQGARDAGFDDVVSKPYTFSKLVPLIKGLVVKNRNNT